MKTLNELTAFVMMTTESQEEFNSVMNEMKGRRDDIIDSILAYFQEWEYMDFNYDADETLQLVDSWDFTPDDYEVIYGAMKAMSDEEGNYYEVSLKDAQSLLSGMEVKHLPLIPQSE